ncbi:MAG: NAD(P)/FAD-dependent oxidoreductase [Halioglobus sp.]
MSTTLIETDYLVVGSGAVGMAFADVLLAETDATITIVDRYAAPGGHWNVAYPFVTLHQPSAFYGVSSSELSKGRVDEVGLNKGLSELASGAEVFAYFDEVMRRTFLPSGRVKYFPMCDYKGNGSFESITSGEQFQVSVAKKTVDATFLKTSVPSTHVPNFSIGENVQFMPLNDLPRVSSAPAGYTIIGGGKTGIDACLWLLETGVDPDSIRWIMPRDAWLLDRQNTQPSEEFFMSSVGSNALQMEAIIDCDSIPDLFARLERAGVLLRIDQSVTPKMFHGATISQLELEQLRRIKNIVRLGRVKQLNENEIVFEHGALPTSPDELHIDCSARAISNEEVVPVFQGDTIVPQMVRSYQPVFSAAVIAHVEVAYENDEQKNGLCGVVPLPNHDTDWIRMFSAFMMNQYLWSQDEALSQWLLENRLDGFSKLMRNVDPQDEEKQGVIKRIRDSAFPAVEKLQQLIAQI